MLKTAISVFAWGLFISGCAVAVKRLPPPDQPQPTVTQVSEIEPAPGQLLTAKPGSTILRVRDYAIKERVMNTHMWRPDEDFTIDAPAWPAYSATTNNIYVAIGTANWHRKNYIVLDDEDGNISWGLAKNAHLLLNEDGTFDGVMGIETGTFDTKVVSGPDPVPFSRVTIEKVEIVRDDSYTNFEIIFISQDNDEVVLAQLDYIHEDDGSEIIIEEHVAVIPVTDATSYPMGKWRIEIQPPTGSEISYSIATLHPR